MGAPISNPTPTTLDWTAISNEAVDHLKALLRIPTVNPPGNERPAADYLARLFEAEGIEHTIVESEPTRASIIARLRATHPSGKGPLLLNGHLDVVGVDREKWTHDPFARSEEHTSELQSRENLVCRLLLEGKA